ncbi:hypothetical protein Tco_1216063 [Tanacetum coccineum]
MRMVHLLIVMEDFVKQKKLEIQKIIFKFRGGLMGDLKDFKGLLREFTTAQFTVLFIILLDVQAPVETNCAYQGIEPIIKLIHWKGLGKEVRKLVINLDKLQFNRTIFYVFFDEMVADCDVFGFKVLERVIGYGYG